MVQHFAVWFIELFMEAEAQNFSQVLKIYEKGVLFQILHVSLCT